MKTFVFYTFLTLVNLISIASATEQIGDLPITIYTPDDGLCSSEVYSTWQTKDGLMWFATEAGICQFNGVEFTLFAHNPEDEFSPSPGIGYRFNEIDNGNLIISYHNKLIDYFDRHTGRFYQIKRTPYQMSNSEIKNGYKHIHQNRVLLSGNSLTAFNIKTHTLEPSSSINANLPNSKAIVSYLHDQIIVYFPDENQLIWLNHQYEIIKKISTHFGSLGPLNLFLMKDNSLAICKDKLYKINNRQIIAVNTNINSAEEQGLYCSSNGSIIVAFNDHGQAIIYDWFNQKHIELPKELQQKFYVNQTLVLANGVFLITTKELIRFDLVNRKWQALNKHDTGFRSYSNFFVDNEKNIWFQVAGKGIAKWSNKGKWFSATYSLPKGNFPSDHVRNFYRDDAHQRLWVATDNNGVYWQHFNDDNWHHVALPKAGITQHPLANSVRSIIPFDQKSILFGTEYHGILRYNWVAQKFIHTSLTISKKLKHKLKLSDAKRFTQSMRLMLHDMNQPIIWSASNALWQLNAKTLKIENIILLPADISFPSIKAISQDKKGNIWLGTHGYGLFRYTPKTQQFKHFDFGDSTHQLNNRDIFSIVEDNYGLIWVATWGGGINIVDPNTGVIATITSKNGLSNNTVFNLIKDNNNDIWASTLNGLNKISGCNIANTNCTPKITQFNEVDGIHYHEFDSESVFKAADGTIYMGGQRGFTYFNPSKFEANTASPTLLLTKLRIGNRNVLTETQASINQAQNQIEISIEHDAPELQLQVLPMSFAAPENNLVKYRFAHGDWQLLLKDKTLHLQRLAVGTHKIEFMGSNNQQVWSKQPYLVKINVLPPWWLKPQMIALYILLGIFSISIFFLLRQRKLKKSQIILNQKVKSRTEQLQAVTQQLEQTLADKQKLFENITHELKTPLTIIMAEVELLLTDRNSTINNKSSLELIENKAHYLLNLINQLLDVARINAQVYRYEQVNPLQQTKQIIANFASQLSSKNLSIHFRCEQQITDAVFINNALNVVLSNLLSNFIKYAVPNNEIALSLIQDGEYYTWQFVDNKTSTNPELTKHNRFKNAKDESKKYASFSSHGLGLSIVQEYVSAHQGQFSIEQSDQIIIKFSLMSCQKADCNIHSELTFPTENSSSSSMLINQSQEQISNKITILCVEDDEDILQVLTKSFNDFTLISAENGQQALELLEVHTPDIIISDVMMPIMDGYEFCRKVKSSPDLSFIHFILLTAKGDFESELLGLSLQADDYISKPFSPKLLKQKIANRANTIVLERKRQKQLWLGAINNETIISSVTDSAETQFSNKLQQCFAQHFHRNSLSIDDIAHEIGCHSRTLSRKCKA